MQYMILIYGDEKAWAKLSEAEMGKAYEEYMTYSKDLAQARALVGGASLQPVATATSVRVVNGKTKTTDGPFAETKEQLGGYYIVDVPNLDEALKWSAKCPGAKHGTIEVRPLGIITAPDGGIAAMQQ
ncbi:MAG TPA: YciI family protein [Gemmataceae bacterium]|nr:YciI family protein [Gemmataceae bacterium]